MPSPVPDRPGLLIRDAYRYSEITLIIPPPLVECLRFFDGQSTDLDLRAYLVRLTGELEVGELEKNLVDTLSASGFLEDENYERRRQERHRVFAGEPSRQPAHAGSAYPAEPDGLRQTMLRYMDGADMSRAASRDGLVGIAAPHVSPEGGWQSYQAAYAGLAPQYKDRTFVVLGTSHYGEPERFGLTRKPFLTPYGETLVDLDFATQLIDRAGDSIILEDYCHSIEHSIEFQVVFLQHLYGPDIRILPILCGSFARSILEGGRPEDQEPVRRFLDVLGDLAAREASRLFWILGIDMAHMGRRYGDPMTAMANQGPMSLVAGKDQERIERLRDGDAEGFWSLVQENGDELKWCGSSPLYTFLRVQPGARADLRRYEQWNIDEQSVVSFAGLWFS